MSGYRETPGGEAEVSPFGLGWWTAPQMARLGWYVSLVALAIGVYQVMHGNRFAVVGVAIAGAGLTLAWLVEALVIPIVRRQSVR